MQPPLPPELRSKRRKRAALWKILTAPLYPQRRGSLQMRRFFLLILLAAFGAVPASASGGAAFFVDGHGWGHGIGMAQWGAYGYALKDGRSYDWILHHYYSDT